MKFSLHIPVFPLNNFIDYFFYYTENRPDHDLERLLPDGGMDLVIDLTETPKRLYNNEDATRYEAFRCAWFSGMRRNYITIDATGETMVVVRFKAGGAGAFFDFPMTELTDKVISMDLIWGQRFRELREKLLQSPTAAEKFTLLERFFLKQMRHLQPLHPAIGNALQIIQQNPASLTVKELSQRSGFSQKHFIQLFERSVGLTPKTYSRIIKFQKVLEHIHAGDAIEWAQIAYACDYYDQAHFINEFKRFSGINPTAYLSYRLPNPGLPRKELFINYLSVDPR